MITAVNQTNSGATLQLRVLFSNKNQFPAGYDTWRKRILISVDIEPKAGKANKKIMELVSSFLDVTSNDIKIVSGLKTRNKSVYVKKSYNKILSIFKKNGF